MTLYEIIDTLKKIALTQPNVRTATDGDIYEKMNGNPSVRYGVFHVTQTTHTEDEQFDNYGFNLFVIDRLEVDDANRVSAQSTAKQILSNIIATFCETFDAEHEVITYQPFTQRFKDNTCGVWASVTMQVVKDYSCAEIFGDGAWRPEIVVINNQDITITSNGVYEPSEGYTGFGKVEVALDIPNVKESDTLYLMAGDNGVYKPESPYNAVGEVIYHVEPNQNKTIDVVENGEYVVMPDEGFGGLGAVEVNVEIPIQEKTETFNYNGDYTIEPDENYAAMKKVNVKVDLDIPVVENRVRLRVNPGESGILLPSEGYNAMREVEYSAPSKMLIPNGINFEGSTIEEFPFDDYDWSVLRDGYNLFKNCTNLKNGEEFLEKIKDGEVAPWYTVDMFTGVPIEVIDGIDFSKFVTSYHMFWDMSNLKEIRNCVAPPKSKTKYSSSQYGTVNMKTNYAAYKIVDCDWSNVTESYDPFGDDYYFANINTPVPLSAMPVNGSRLFAVGFEPDTIYTSNDREIWYKPGLTGWQGANCVPWGFSFIDKTGGIESVELVSNLISDKVTETQVIPYVGDGKFETDYPIFRGYKVKVNGIIAPALAKNYTASPYTSADLYLPISNPTGVYEGADIAKLIYYGTPPTQSNKRMEITEQGIELYVTCTKLNDYTFIPFAFVGNNGGRVSITFEKIDTDNKYSGTFSFETLEGTETSNTSTLKTETYAFGEVLAGHFMSNSYVGEYGVRITKIEYL